MNVHHKKKLLSAALASALSVFVVGCDNLQGEDRMPPPGTTVGTEIDDSVITARVKSALLADPYVRSFGPKIETHNGKVQLSGFVDSQGQIERVIEIAQAVEGVQSVENRMSLKGSSRTVGTQVDDGIVTAKVRSALLADADTKSFDIGVVTRKGEVQLSGYVGDQMQMDHAIAVARGVEGVHSVGNKMSIKQ